MEAACYPFDAPGRNRLQGNYAHVVSCLVQRHGTHPTGEDFLATGDGCGSPGMYRDAWKLVGQRQHRKTNWDCSGLPFVAAAD